MREDFLLKFGEDGWKVNLELEAEKLRARAVAGKVALEASRKAESQEAERVPPGGRTRSTRTLGTTDPCLSLLCKARHT